MPMGIVSDSEFEQELSRCEGKVVEKPNEHGRNNGDVNVPNSLRELIGIDALENGRGSALELAKSLGISASSTSAYKNGATSTASYNEGNKELRGTINQAKARIIKKARIKLSSALNHITEEKLESAKLTEVSSVARDMSAIIKNMEPQIISEEDNGKKGNVNVILYAPRTRDEKDYEVVVVDE